MHAVPEENSVASGGVKDEGETGFVFPTTLAQRRFWLLDQLQPGGNPALNMSVALRWRGPIEPPVLRRALNQVVARHEALRTTFDSEGGQLRQFIAPTLVLDLDVIEANGAPEEMVRAEAQKCFDLRAGPLLRATIVRVAAEEHLLLLTVHHIVSDGWSNGILVRDLCASYTAFLHDQSPSLLPLSLQFADYADWQESRLADDNFAAQRAYWRDKLEGDLPGLDLPFDRPPRGSPTSAGDARSRILSPALTRAAKSLGAAESASPFMIFFAVFQVLLHRYTGQVEFLVTSPSANRERREFETVVGLFVNPLLLRADLRGDPNFRELLGRVRNVALEAFSNQDIPFESLLDEFRAARLQVNFHYDAGWQPLIDVPEGVTIEPLATTSAGTVYELSASVIEESNGLRLELEYNTALFDAATIERMLDHYERLLQSAVADAARAVSTLPMLTSGEERHHHASPGKALEIRQRLIDHVLAQPDAIVARHGRRELSCAEILARLESTRFSAFDLDQIAAWIGHWRARVDSPAPPVAAQLPEAKTSLAAASFALRERAALIEHERIASCTPPGLAATEEIGASLLANTPLVYPTPGLLSDSPAALAGWLHAENISVAFLPAATWNRLAAAIAGRKVRKPAKLRMVIATEGNADEGTFGRVTASADETLRVCERVVVEAAGGTVVLDGRILPEAAWRMQILDLRSGQPLPVGVAGELAVAGGGQKWTGTGELARWRPNESIERLGPIAEQQFARGFRVDLQHTERALSAVTGIRHALVRRVHETGLISYIWRDHSAGPLPNDATMRQLLREQGAPDPAIPKAFLRLKEIPLRDLDGRLDLSALPLLSKSADNPAPEPVRPYLGLQLQLIAIWEDVLAVRGIGIRDDFFDLGGNSLLAIRMLQRAEAAFGKVISPAALFRHPTIEHLAGEMARDAINESPSLLRVNDAGTRTPFFYLHGDLSGGGFYSLRLSRALGADQPFYVMPPQDVRDLPAAPTIEEMAASHLETMRAVRPKGPYIIGGFCIGGLVAFELAQQLKASGEEVEMLLIIDAAPDSKVLRALRSLAGSAGALLRWDEENKVRQFGRWAVWRARLDDGIWRNVRAQTRAAPRRIYRRLDALRNRVRRLSAPEIPAGDYGNALRIERDLPSVFQWASAGYRPRQYHGRVALLLSEDVIAADKNPTQEWRGLVPEVTVRALPGSHLECITEHVQTLAKEIESSLEELP